MVSSTDLIRDWRKAVVEAGQFVDAAREHELVTYASAIARAMVVATVSLALLFLGVLASIGRENLWTTHLAPQIEPRVNAPVFAAIQYSVHKVFAADSPWLILFAIVLAVWGVSGAVRGAGNAMNRIYGTKESRSWKVRYPVSVAISAIVILALLAAVLIVMAAGGLVNGAASIPFSIGRWIVAFGALAVAFGVLVRYAPAEPRPIKWASLGAALVVVGWAIESLAFSWYVTSVADFKTAIGNLTVVLVVISYLYVAAIVFLVGVEIDELARRKAR